MAGPQVQRPASAYYTGLNGSSNGGHHGNNANGGGGGTGPGGGGGLVTSTSHHTGLHTIRTISHDSELIYRGSTITASNGTHLTQHNSNNNGTGGGGSHTSLHHHETCTASTSRSVIQQQPGPTSSIGSISGGGGIAGVADSSTINIASIAGTGQNPSDALIVPVTTALQQHQQQQSSVSAEQQHSFQAFNRDKQRSIEIIVDASKCGDLKSSEDDVEQGKSRRSSRHRHRPLHRRLMNYLKSFFHRSTTQT
ncbi:headcase protein-like, partial [Musca vetustissima]|uniref:headcase protein-like n=1 Tax=Musca vetustissima TaxID=27455 RepID=UPI002AB7E037